METTEIRKLASEWGKIADVCKQDYNEVRDQFLSETKKELDKIASVLDLDKLNNFIKTARDKGYSEDKIEGFLTKDRMARFLK